MQTLWTATLLWFGVKNPHWYFRMIFTSTRYNELLIFCLQVILMATGFVVGIAATLGARWGIRSFLFSKMWVYTSPSFSCRFCDLVNSITEEAWKGPEEGECDADALEVTHFGWALTLNKEPNKPIYATVGKWGDLWRLVPDGLVWVFRQSADALGLSPHHNDLMAPPSGSHYLKDGPIKVAGGCSSSF